MASPSTDDSDKRSSVAPLLRLEEKCFSDESTLSFEAPEEIEPTFQFEYASPEAKPVKLIDYILAYETYSDDPFTKARANFERRLESRGLVLRHESESVSDEVSFVYLLPILTQG